MQRTINHLVQLQELILIRDEQKVAETGKHIEQLDASIAEMIQELPREIRSRFEGLRKRNHNVIVPVAHGVCSVCGMQLPISLVQAVQLARELQACPNCARILYYPTAAPRRMHQSRLRPELAKGGIARFSSESLMVPHLQAKDKEGAIQELASKMEEEGFVEGADKLVDAAMRREAIVSTAVRHGLAFPHVRGVEGGALTLALGIRREGIDFGATGRTKTRIVFFMVIPTAASAFYLKLLAGLTEAFVDADAREQLMAEDDPKKLWRTLVKLTRATIK